MNSLEAMYGCGLNFFIKLAYNSLFYISLQRLRKTFNRTFMELKSKYHFR